MFCGFVGLNESHHFKRKCISLPEFCGLIPDWTMRWKGFSCRPRGCVGVILYLLEFLKVTLAKLAAEEDSLISQFFLLGEPEDQPE